MAGEHASWLVEFLIGDQLALPRGGRGPGPDCRTVGPRRLRRARAGHRHPHRRGAAGRPGPGRGPRRPDTDVRPPDRRRSPRSRPRDRRAAGDVAVGVRHPRRRATRRDHHRGPRSPPGPDRHDRIAVCRLDRSGHPACALTITARRARGGERRRRAMAEFGHKRVGSTPVGYLVMTVRLHMYCPFTPSPAGLRDAGAPKGQPVG
jgi:hypothetical protein